MTTIQDIKKQLDDLGISYPANAKKKALLALVPSNLGDNVSAQNDDVDNSVDNDSVSVDKPQKSKLSILGYLGEAKETVVRVNQKETPRGLRYEVLTLQGVTYELTEQELAEKYQAIK